MYYLGDFETASRKRGKPCAYQIASRVADRVDTALALVRVLMHQFPI